MAPVEMTKFVVIGESEQQIPGGNDRKKNKDKDWRLLGFVFPTRPQKRVRMGHPGVCW